MKLLLSLLALLWLPFCTQAQDTDALHVENPWVRESAPTAQVLGAFMHIHNRGKETVIITAVHSPQFDAVEIHQTVLEDGIARMIPQENITLKADAHIDLEPGGYHLMLMGPKQVLRAGDIVEIILDYNHQQQRLQAAVRKGMDEDEADPHAHHHHQQ